MKGQEKNAYRYYGQLCYASRNPHCIRICVVAMIGRLIDRVVKLLAGDDPMGCQMDEEYTGGWEA